jgi:predicted ATP-grasp superfamily ATP-dependent carboligase
MERTERELIHRVLDTNFEVRKLYDQHKKYEEKVKKLSRQPYLTATEEQELRRLKQLKLHGVERMIRLSAAE